MRACSEVCAVFSVHRIACLLTPPPAFPFSTPPPVFLAVPCGFIYVPRLPIGTQARRCGWRLAAGEGFSQPNRSRPNIDKGVTVKISEVVQGAPSAMDVRTEHSVCTDVSWTFPSRFRCGCAGVEPWCHFQKPTTESTAVASHMKMFRERPPAYPRRRTIPKPHTESLLLPGFPRAIISAQLKQAAAWRQERRVEDVLSEGQWSRHKELQAEMFWIGRWERERRGKAVVGLRRAHRLVPAQSPTQPSMCPLCRCWAPRPAHVDEESQGSGLSR